MDDDDEYENSGEDEDVLPVPAEVQPDELAEPVFAFLPGLIEADEKIYVSDFHNGERTWKMKVCNLHRCRVNSTKDLCCPNTTCDS